MPVSDIQFFGAIDRKGKKEDGVISSEYPAWYFTNQIKNLKESIERKRRSLKRGDVDPSQKPYIQAELQQEELKLSEIMEKGMPKIDDKDKDSLHKIYKELEGRIQDSMFSRDEMMKGLADAHEEARRMTTSCIDVKGAHGSISMFKNVGITPRDGKVSRNQASRMYKIIGRYLGENTNVEALRRSQKTGTFNANVSLADVMRG